MELIIVRHADAGDRDARKYPDDDERPLSAKGKRVMARVARGMKRAGMQIGSICDSGLVRARQTSEIVARRFGIKSSAIRLMKELEPDVAPARTAAALSKLGPFENLALVGHEPQLGRLVGYLVAGGGQLDVTLKKSGVCRLRADRWSRGSASLLELIAPRTLGGSPS
jgi:phosphohistidine phosphatase